MFTTTLKKLRTSLLVAPLLLGILTGLVYAAPAAAKHPVPFKGSLQAVETNQLDAPNLTLFVAGSGSGHATHLGQFSFAYEVAVSLVSGSGPASIQLVAANGDTISATGFGQGSPTVTPNVAMIVETYTITGGTGRFEGASGSFIVTRQVNQVTGVTFGTFDGSILIP
jgi:hypothetical protein